MKLYSSMFAVWGSRTEDSSLFSARNLDWNQDTGICAINSNDVSLLIEMLSL